MSPPTGQKISWLGYQAEVTYGSTLTASATSKWDWQPTVGTGTNQFLWKDFSGTLVVTNTWKIDPVTGNWEMNVAQEFIPDTPVKKTRRGHKHKLRMPELEIGDLE